jgi:hypothetical protein
MIKIIFISILVLILILVKYFAKRKKTKNLYGVPTEIKERYKKISVSINKINIKTRGYYESNEEEEYQTRIKILDALYNKDSSEKHYKQVSVLLYEGLSIRGKPITLKSTSIYLPEVILYQKLKQQTAIDIYFDENKVESVYYDLSFLNKSLTPMNKMKKSQTNNE